MSDYGGYDNFGGYDAYGGADMNLDAMFPADERPFMGMTISMPAIIALVTYAVLCVVIMLPFEFPLTDERTGDTYTVRYIFVERLILLILLAIPAVLSVYTINCMVVGKCMLWSYAIALISVFWVALFVIGAIMYTFRR